MKNIKEHVNILKQSIIVLVVLSLFIIINTSDTFAALSCGRCRSKDVYYTIEGGFAHYFCDYCSFRWKRPAESASGDSGEGEELPCEHEWGRALIYDETHHIRKCENGCKAISAEVHYYKGGKCTCGRKIDGTCEHDYSGRWEITEEMHKKMCANGCGASKEGKHVYSDISGKCICEKENDAITLEELENNKEEYDPKKCTYENPTPGHPIEYRYQATGSEKDHYQYRYCTYCEKRVSKRLSVSHYFKGTYNSNSHISTCVYCNKVVEGKHEYKTSYLALNSQQHEVIKQCKSCNYMVKEVENHSSGSSCSKCKLVVKCSRKGMVEGHTAEAEYIATSSKKHHYETLSCKICNVILSTKVSKEHVFTNTKTKESHVSTCTLCGKAVEENHKFKTTYEQNNAQTHLRKDTCTVCEYSTPAIPEEHTTKGTSCSKCGLTTKCSNAAFVAGHESSIEYTCEATSSKTTHKKVGFCSICQVKVSVEEAHDFTSQIDDEKHTSICKLCGKEVSGKHSFSTTYEKKDSNMHNKIETCKVCQYVRTTAEEHKLKNGKCRYCDLVTLCSKYGVVEGHTLTSTYNMGDDKNHRVYQSCPICNVNISDGQKEPHEFTKTSTAAYQISTCNICGKVVKEAHKKAENSYTGDEVHTNCSCCEGGHVTKIKDESVMEIYQITAGPANATLIRCGDEVIMVDGGVNPGSLSEKQANLGRVWEKRVMETLEGLGLEKGDIDRYIITHNHGDHTANTQAILNLYGDENTVIYGATVERSMDELGTNLGIGISSSTGGVADAEYVQFKPGEVEAAGKLTMKAVGPDKVGDGWTNTDSLNVVISFNGENAYLITGDYLGASVGENYGEDIANTRVITSVHHANKVSDYSFDEKTMGIINPEVVLVNGNSHTSEYERKMRESGVENAEYYNDSSGLRLVTINDAGELNVFTEVQLGD